MRAVASRHDHRARRELRVGKRLVECGDRRHAAVDRRELLDPGGERRAGKDALELAPYARAFFSSRELASDEVAAPERCAQRLPELRFERSDGEPAPVLSGIDAVARHASGQQVVAARAQRSPLVERGERHHIVRERRVRHGDVDVATASGSLRIEQRGEQRNRRCRCAAEQVGDLQIGKPRRAVARAGLIEDAGVAEVIDVVAREVRTRTRLPISADRRVDDPRSDLAIVS
jgi:hypothetical protein